MIKEPLPLTAAIIISQLIIHERRYAPGATTHRSAPPKSLFQSTACFITCEEPATLHYTLNMAGA